jgi:hypothetical protein
VKNVVRSGAGLAAVAALACLTACSSSSTSRHQPQAGGAATLPTSLPSGTLSSSTAAPSSSAAPAIPDACTLLTREEAEKAAGVKLEKGEDTRAASADNVASCTYNAPVTGSSGSISVFAGLTTPDELTTDRNLGHKFRTVPGLGDQALQETMPATVFVHVHGVWVTVSSAYSASPAAMLAAARLAASRVP